MKVLYRSKVVSRGDSGDYVNLQNKPMINDVELLGNVSTEGANITKYCSQAEYDDLVAMSAVNPTTIYIIDDGELTDNRDDYNYNELYNKPQLYNGNTNVVLQGTINYDDLELYNKTDTDTLMANYLPLAGGTMTGSVTSNANVSMKASTDSSKLLLMGSTDQQKGALLYLYGKDNTDNPGEFWLGARTGSSAKWLAGKPDGTLTWNGQQLFPAKTLTPTAGTNIGIARQHCYQIGNMVFVNLVIEANAAVSAWANIITGLPKAASADQYFACMKYSSLGRFDLYVSNSNNSIQSPNALASGDKVLVNFQYLTNEA